MKKKLVLALLMSTLCVIMLTVIAFAKDVDIKINDDIYYPHYANKIKTSSLTGALHVNGSKTIKTSLYINH